MKILRAIGWAILYALALAMIYLLGRDAYAGNPDQAEAIVIFDGPATVITPNGDRLAIPSHSSIDLCLGEDDKGNPGAYALRIREVHLLAPCTGIFTDGFE